MLRCPVPPSVLTEEMKEEARQLACQIKCVMEDNFGEPNADPEKKGEVREMVKRLNKMGFFVDLELGVDHATRKPIVEVSLFIL